MSRKAKVVFMVVTSALLVLALIPISCTGPAGPVGPAGPAGPEGLAGPPGPTPEVGKAAAVIGMKPDSATEGGRPGTFTFWGAGFQPGEAITITMVAAVGGEDWMIGGAEANESGAFYRTGVEVVSSALPPDLKQGVYAVKAGGSKGTEANCAFLVSPPPTPTPAVTPTPKPAT